MIAHPGSRPSHRMFLGLALTTVVGGVPVSAARAQTPEPTAPPAGQPVPTNRIVLTLTSSHDPSINGQRLRWDHLDAEFRAIYTRRPERVLYLRAHPSNDYQTVARVVTMAKRRGITVRFVPYRDT